MADLVGQRKESGFNSKCNVCIMYINVSKMEYYPAIKRNKIGSFGEIWMDLKSVMYSEISHRESTSSLYFFTLLI